MASIELITSKLFEGSYEVDVRVIMCADVVHRKNRNFGLDALRQSGFAKCIVELIEHLPKECTDQILGTAPPVDELNVSSFCNIFLLTNCDHFVNMHDDKMCTVEFTCKFKTTLKILADCLHDDILSHLHLEVITPVGSVQL